MERNNVVFPNLAIGLVKEGLNKDEIDNIMQPIIENNFPGKLYNEFEGWLKKAFEGTIDTYNQVQINIWCKNNNIQEMYDLKPIEYALESVIETDRADSEIEFIWDNEIPIKIKDIKIEWLVENWIPKGDICFIAGKAA